MMSGGSACGGGTALARMVQSKATSGLPSVVASPDLRREGVNGTAGVVLRCLDPSKKCSARASGDAGDGKEKSGSCIGTGVTSGQGRQGGRTGDGKAVGTVGGGRVSD